MDSNATKVDFYTVGNKIKMPFAYFVEVLVNDLVDRKDFGESLVLRNLRFESPFFDNSWQVNRLMRSLRIERSAEDGRFEVASEYRTLLSGVFVKSPPAPVMVIKESIEGEAKSKLSCHDIYSELNMRGYKAPKGLKVIDKVDFEMTEAEMMNNSLFACLEAMIQLQLLAEPLTFGKQVSQPFSIDEFVVAVELLNKRSKEPKTATIKKTKAGGFTASLGVQISGLKLAATDVDVHQGVKPIIEQYRFVPHFETLEQFSDFSEAAVRERLVRASFTIAMTNCFEQMMVTDEICLDGLPLVEELQSWFGIFNTKPKFVDSFQSTTVHEKSLETFRLLKEPSREPFLLVIKSVLPSRSKLINGERLAEQASELLKPGSFVLAVVNKELADSLANGFKKAKAGFILVNERKTPSVSVLLLRKATTGKGLHPEVFEIKEEESYKWLETIQKKQDAGDDRIWIRSSEPLSGLSGLINCFRHERGGQSIRGLFTPGQSAMSIPESIYTMDLALNICLEGEWGVFQYLLLDEDLKRNFARPRQHFFSHKVYIVTGGLGGIGLQLCRWMVAAGARKLVLTCRTHTKGDYQNFALWRMRQAAKVVVFQDPLADEKGCQQLINKCLEMGPVGGLFHLPVVLADGAFRRQTPESFRACCEPKVGMAGRLARVVSARAPDIDYFILFSSCVGSHGAFGVSNYGYANSAIEQLCRERELCPAVRAFQWGALGGFGVAQRVTESLGVDVIVGTALMPLSSMFDLLDR